MNYQSSNIPVITIDGPSGSGKGTISRQLAEYLDWQFLDSGALYRLVALGASKRKIAFDDIAALAHYAEHLDVQFFSNPDIMQDPLIELEGEEVSSDIRNEEIGKLASQVAVISAVRSALLARQRAFRQPPGLVADGRDMGTTVFPDAVLKIFLTASPEQRAQRRYKQLKQKGNDVSLASLVQEITARDERDSTRAVSPLIPAADAVIVDTSTMDIAAVMQQVIALCRERQIMAAK